MKIVINNCFGGFSLSYQAVMRYAEIKGFRLWAWLDDITKKVYGQGIKPSDNARLCVHYSRAPTTTEQEYKKYNKKHPNNDAYFSDRDIERNDPILIQVVEELGEKANGSCAKLKIVEIPDNVDWEIAEYDGNEHIAEKHQTWY